MDAARRSVAAAEEAGRTYAIMQNRRFDPNIRRYRDFLASGTIGPITTLHCDFFVAPHFGGFRAIMDHVLLLDMAIHTFDAARMISGADPVAVYCHEWNPQGSWMRHGSSAVAIFEMTGGLVFTYRGSWCGEGCNTTWEADWRAIGTQGTACWNGATDFRAQVVNGKEGFEFACGEVEIPTAQTNGHPVGHAGQIAHFLECLKDGKTPETNCTDNIKSLAMVFGAIESAESGRRVEIIL
jgi:predicted dehydrogenase